MIVWLASYPKSGNTWIRLMLAAYDSGQVDINTITGSVGDKESYFWHAVAHRDVQDMTPLELAHLRPAALLHQMMFADAAGANVVCKTHHWNAKIEEVPLIPPGLTKAAIYVVRDPRDVALSYAAHYKMSIDEAIRCMGDEKSATSTPGKVFKHYLGTWSDHVASWLADHPYPILCIRYEQIEKEPQTVLAEVLKIMGYEPDHKKVTAAVEACKFESLRKQEDKDGFKEAKGGKFFRVGCSGQWKSVLTDKQVKKIERDHEAAMKGLGYL